MAKEKEIVPSILGKPSILEKLMYLASLTGSANITAFDNEIGQYFSLSDRRKPTTDFIDTYVDLKKKMDERIKEAKNAR